VLRLRPRGGAVRPRAAPKAARSAARAVGPTVGLAGGAIIAVALAACGAAHAPPATQGSAGPDPMPPLADVRAEIEALDLAIATDRASLDLDAPGPEAIAAVQAAEVGRAGGTCAPPAGDRCVDACRLSDAICSNAARICELARGLPGDAWATERCDAGKASCAASIERCCGCQP
jgi:hypothetical protein